MEPTGILILSLTLALMALATFFIIRYSKKKTKQQQEQYQLLAAHLGHQVVKKRMRNNIFYPKIPHVVGQLDGNDSKIFSYVVSAGNTHYTMTAIELEVPFLKELTLFMGKENLLTNAFKALAGDGFVTRDEEFDNSYKIRTNNSLLLKKVLMNESLRQAFLEHRKLVKGRFVLKKQKLRYEEAMNFFRDQDREKLQKIIELIRLFVSQLKALMIVEEESPKLEISLSEEEEKSPIQLKNEENKEG